MHITFYPQMRQSALALERKGNTLILDGREYDFSVIPEGASLIVDETNVDSEFIVRGSAVERIGGVLHLHIILPFGPYADESARFPEQIVNPPDGPLALPNPGFINPNEGGAENED